MIDLQDKKALEHHFAENFDTPVFPVLADIYFNESDMMRARKVCEIGLKHHPRSVEGQYLLAKVELVDNNMTQAEKLLKSVADSMELHIPALKLLVELQEELGRSRKTIYQTVEKILGILPNESFCLKWLNTHQKELSNSDTNEKEKPTDPDTIDSIHGPESTGDEINIDQRIATMTLARVFKMQKNFNQALGILEIVENKGGNIAEIDRERQEIQKLINEQDLTE